MASTDDFFAKDGPLAGLSLQSKGYFLFDHKLWQYLKSNEHAKFNQLAEEMLMDPGEFFD